MSELRVGEGGGSDRRAATGPAGREHGGQASIDWGRWFPERTGYAEYARRYVQELLDEGRIEELRSAALTGTALARARLAEIYAAQGRIEELRSLVHTKDAPLARLLAGTLADTTAGQDGLEAAVAVTQVRLETGEKDALDQLIKLLRAQDRVEEAITFLQARPEENDYTGWHLLVHLLLVQGRIEDVRTMAGDSRRPYARALVTGVFAEQGRIEELRALSAHGYVLSHALVGQGRVDEAIAVMRECVEANEKHAHDFLIKLLVGQGRADQALTALESRSHNPHESTSTASLDVARLLDEQGRAEDAIRILRTRAHAPEQLAALLAGQGRADEAVKVLDRAMADAKHSSVIQRLAEAQADLLVEHDRIDELRTRAETGHRAYGVRLAAYLTEPGRTA
jgi:tetratricopeptide (TPR) repeat protein